MTCDDRTTQCVAFLESQIDDCPKTTLVKIVGLFLRVFNGPVNRAELLSFYRACDYFRTFHRKDLQFLHHLASRGTPTLAVPLEHSAIIRKRSGDVLEFIGWHLDAASKAWNFAFDEKFTTLTANLKGSVSESSTQMVDDPAVLSPVIQTDVIKCWIRSALLGLHSFLVPDWSKEAQILRDYSPGFDSFKKSGHQQMNFVDLVTFSKDVFSSLFPSLKWDTILHYTAQVAKNLSSSTSLTPFRLGDFVSLGRILRIRMHQEYGTLRTQIRSAMALRRSRIIFYPNDPDFLKWDGSPDNYIRLAILYDPEDTDLLKTEPITTFYVTVSEVPTVSAMVYWHFSTVTEENCSPLEWEDLVFEKASKLKVGDTAVHTVASIPKSVYADKILVSVRKGMDRVAKRCVFKFQYTLVINVWTEVVVHLSASDE